MELPKQVVSLLLWQRRVIRSGQPFDGKGRKRGFGRACFLGVEWFEREAFLIAKRLERFEWFCLLERYRWGVEA